MKATGIVRRVDDLGRIVLPIDTRRQCDIKEGDPLEIFIDKSDIILRKYVNEPEKDSLEEMLRKYAEEYRKEPAGREVQGTAELLDRAADTIIKLKGRLTRGEEYER